MNAKILLILYNSSINKNLILLYFRHNIVFFCYENNIKTFLKATFCNVYLMLFSFNTIVTLNCLLGIISQPSLMCDYFAIY